MSYNKVSSELYMAGAHILLPLNKTSIAVSPIFDLKLS